MRPAYRRSGYGRAMFGRLEALFARDGVSRMYLTADPVTGKPFWEAMGFSSTGERSPENRLEIYEKSVKSVPPAGSERDGDAHRPAKTRGPAEGRNTP